MSFNPDPKKLKKVYTHLYTLMLVTNLSYDHHIKSILNKVKTIGLLC